MLEVLLNDLLLLGTSAGMLALLNIILIDVVMSGDNAILIGMATRNLTGAMRKKAIFYGILGATILRIIFSFGVVFLLAIPGLEFLGALLLLYVVWKFYREIRAQEHHENGTAIKATLWGAIKMLIIADVAMSLDNVLAVAGASHGNYAYLAIGLVVSILLMVIASGYIAILLGKYPSIQWVGLFVILFTALEMLEKGFSKVSPDMFGDILEANIFSLILIVVVSVFSVLQTKYLSADHSRFADWAKANGRILMISNFILLTLLVTVGDKIYAFVNNNHGYKYGLLMIAVLGMLEILRLRENNSGKIETNS